MLDWFSGYVGYDASELALGQFFEVDAHGQLVRRVDRWETARGSYSAGVQVTRGMPTDGMLASKRDYGFLCAPHAVLKVSGNPSKFLQGHNAAGPSVAELGPVLQGLVRAFGEGLRPADADDPTLPAVHRSRVDCTTSADLGSHQAVHDWLRMAATNTRSRHGRAMDSSGTVYWGKNSTRWSLKAYCKHCELQAHPPADLELLPELLDWTRTQLRIELTLRRPELKTRGTLTEAVVWEYAGKVEVAAMREKAHADLNLRPAVKAALQLWYNGTAMESFYPRRTLYRYRKEILGETGIDILLPRVDQSTEAQAALLSFDELREREVRNVPERIQRSLFGASQ